MRTQDEQIDEGKKHTEMHVLLQDVFVFFPEREIFFSSIFLVVEGKRRRERERERGGERER